MTIAVVFWLVSIRLDDVSIVDSLWSAMFVLVAITYAAWSVPGPRSGVVLALVSLWAVRLSVFITWRNWGEEEDKRYREIRKNNRNGH